MKGEDIIKNEELLNRVLHGSCFEWLPYLEDKSIDMILCDLPYGTTQAKWDSVLPFDLLWKEYERIIKDNGAIVLTASQPFTSALVMSNPKLFKYEWVWDKVKPSGHLNAKIMPMKQHENVLVFSRGKITYKPIMEEQKERISKNYLNKKSEIFGSEKVVSKTVNQKYPKTIISFSNANQKKKKHPTQKPVELFQYLIETYTEPQMTVLDNCLGSGTTAVACINSSRNFIGIEQEWDYCEIANKRIEEVKKLKF